MNSLESLTNWRGFGVLVLGLLLVLGVSNTDTPTNVSAHGGDTNVVHACVNDTNAEVRIAHPGPGD